MDSMMIGSNPVDTQSNFTGPNRIAEQYAALGHDEFWDRVYGKGPEGPSPWDIEDMEED